MTRLLAWALTLSLLAPSPAFAALARPVVVRSAPTTAAPIPAIAPTAVTPSLTFRAPAPVLKAPVVSPMLQVQETVDALPAAGDDARAELAEQALTMTFDGALVKKAANDPVYAVGVKNAAPVGPLSRRIMGLTAAATLAIPAATNALPAGQPTTLAEWGFWTVALSIAGIVGSIYAFTKWREHRQNKAMEEAAREAEAERTARAFEGADYLEGQKAPAPKKTNFNDVAGQEEAKGELRKVVNYLKDPSRYRKLGAKGFKGVLMYGPPGTGKTLMARAVAEEAGAGFFHANGSDFVQEYVGVGAKRVRELFERARRSGKPAIIFIDEIDGIGKKRSEDGKGNSEYEQTLNALLAEIDGFERDNIIVIAATNRPDMLDPALTRGRRFGLKVPVGLPDVEGREKILGVHAAGMKLDDDVNLRKVAEQTPGLAGADLEEIANDAAMMAADRGAETVTQADFTAAVDRSTIGHARKLIMSKEEKRVVAYHETGHALVSHLLPNADPVRKVTIVPHGLNALGLMQAMPEEERHIQSRAWLVDRMAVALGGRAAEKLFTGEIYSGAQNDIEAATRIARAMVMKFGMSPELGTVDYEKTDDPRVAAEVKKLLDEALARAEQVLSENRPVVEMMVAELLERETLRADDLDRLIPNGKPSKK